MLGNLLLLEANSGQRVAGEIALIVVCVLTCGYLLAALLWPEKF
ncbi:MAG TPA: K(+)-transporting ATPase subunit F [Candidatus Acidoferrales bacterium]|nr:K(+)-transporting ATPase subunit F [Candidatus Acidoferrales bacterium]